MRINGEGGHIAEILTTGQCGIGYIGRYLIGCTLHVLGVTVGQSVLGQDGVHLGVVLTGGTQDVYYLSNGVAVRGIGPLNDLYHRFLSVTAFL